MRKKKIERKVITRMEEERKDKPRKRKKGMIYKKDREK